VSKQLKKKFKVGQVVVLDGSYRRIHDVTKADPVYGGWHYWIGGIGYAACLLKPLTKCEKG
jgi:hypothetical protein